MCSFIQTNKLNYDAFVSIIRAILVFVYLFEFQSSVLAASLSDLTYREEIDGNITITDCEESASGSLMIPAEINGKPVTRIANGAFYSCYHLTSIVIPDSITAIEAYAFSNCRMSSMTIPGNVTSISSNAFRHCIYLTSITLGEGVASIGNSAFVGCEDLVYINIPDSVTEIGNYAFWACSSLTSVSIGNSVNYIGSHAFKECFNLETVNIPDSVSVIGAYAFNRCHKITSLTIGSGVTSMGEHAFSEIASLRDVTIKDGATSIGNHAFYACRNLVNLAISNEVTSIGDYAFWSCTNLNELDLPNSVIGIGDHAFQNCWSLSKITIPSSVNSVGDYAFSNCKILKAIIMEGDAPSHVGFAAFGSTAPEATLYFYEGASGFTVPIWYSPASNLASLELKLNGDFDNDTFPNNLERLLGTNPLNQNDHLKVYLSRDQTDMRLHFKPYSEQCQFVVYSTTDISDPNGWQIVSDLNFSGNSDEQNAILPYQINSAFYRIEVIEKQ